MELGSQVAPEDKTANLEVPSSDKQKAIQAYMDWVVTTPEFKKQLKDSCIHYIDTGEIKYVGVEDVKL